MKTIIAATAASFALAMSLNAACAGTASDKDKSFIASVSQGGMFEVQAGTLAASQGSTQDIKDQGTTEEHDHTLVGDKLKSIAAADGVTFPSTLNATFQKEYDDLEALNGEAFDKAYLKDMLAIHAKDGATLAKEARDGGDPALKDFAAETHRIVERHIGELKALPAD